MSAKKSKKTEQKPMLFTSLNYKLIGLGLLLLIIGFTAMRIENKVDGIISLYVSPVIIIAGYAIVVFAILKRDHKIDDSSTPTKSSS